MIELSGLQLAQGNGHLPTVLAAGSAMGESGVSVLSLRFARGAHFSATPERHVIWFQTQARFACRIAGRALCHEPTAGSLAICPAGIESAADTDESVDVILVRVDPETLALAAAEGSALEARLVERLTGYDQDLLILARTLAGESAANYPNGALYWNEVASDFVDRLIGRHTLEVKSRSRISLGKDVFDRLRDHIMAHLDDAIEVDTLAKIAGRSPFHFSRVFTRSVGVTPHRYVVHLRLQRAAELVREGKSSLAEIAASTGFADQSHLSRWVKRVHGASLTQFYAP